MTGDATVLLVEPDPDIANLERHHLERLGYRVVHADGGQEALELARQHAPTLVVAELLLPDMAAPELVDRLRSSPTTRNCRVVAATRLDPQDLTVAVDAILSKPFLRADVTEAVARALDRGGPIRQ